MIFHYFQSFHPVREDRAGLRKKNADFRKIIAEKIAHNKNIMYLCIVIIK